MPFGNGNYGTERDGTASREFCMLCHQNGEFTEPDLTLEEMVEKSMRHMTSKLGMPEEEASRLAGNVIPSLARWRE